MVFLPYRCSKWETSKLSLPVFRFGPFAKQGFATSQNKKPRRLAWFPKCRGAGGIRTLVQTCCVTAFYMFSFCLNCREIAGQKLPTHSVSSLECLRNIKALFPIGLLLRSPEIDRRKPRQSRDFLLVRLADRGIILL